MTRRPSRCKGHDCEPAVCPPTSPILYSMNDSMVSVIAKHVRHQQAQKNSWKKTFSKHVLSAYHNNLRGFEKDFGQNFFFHLLTSDFLCNTEVEGRGDKQ